jgi:5'-nucleotidase
MVPKRVLVTNDDGIHAAGIQQLAAALEPRFEVWVIAPDREQSARSHALTLHRPLRLIPAGGERRFSVDGTPADSVYLAVNHVLGGSVDLIVSGINHGPNLGDDVAYSGTVSAAMEGVFMGIPAFAISLAGRDPFDFSVAASFAASLAETLLERPLPGRTFLNVNVPNLPREQVLGVRTTRLGHRRYSYAVEQKIDPRGRHYYWIGGGELDFQDCEGSDGNAIRDRHISVTPLATDLTDHQMLGTLAWMNTSF